MPQLQHQPLHYDVGSIFSWLVHTQTIETRDSDSHSDIEIDIDPDIGDNGGVVAAAAIAAVAATAMDDAPKTPQKRRRDEKFDADQTPRGLQPPPAHGSLDAPDTSDSLSLCSGSADDASNASNTSTRSGRSSPRKREIALRLTTQYPVYREPIDTTAPPPLPQTVLDLLRDLISISSGKQAVIPSIFKGSLPSSWLYDPNNDDGLFFPLEDDQNDGSEQDFALRHRHAILRDVCDQSRFCESRIEHEAGWNELVHSRLLSDALGGLASVHFRNITACRVRPAFRDPDPAVGETKVDYGIFLNSPAVDTESLRSELGTVPVTHFGLSDNAPTPLAISIETKSAAADKLMGSTQLATWVRAHFRHLEIAHNTLQVKRAAIGNPLALPALPLVFALGSEWFVQVACRREGKTFIYHSVAIGKSDTLHGCYKISAAIRRLAGWATKHFAAWWSDALGKEGSL